MTYGATRCGRSSRLRSPTSTSTTTLTSRLSSGARVFAPHHIVVRSGRSDGTRGTVQSVRWRGGFFDRGLGVSDFNRDGWMDLVAVGESPSLGLRILLNWTGQPAPPCVVVPVTRVRARIAERDIKRAGCQLGRVNYRY